MGLLTTTVGWFPKSRALRRARWRFAEDEISEADLRAAEELATAQAVKLQEELGIDLLVDGQLDRSDMITHFGEHLEGMEPAGLVRCFDNRYYRRPRIVGDVRHVAPVTVESWKVAQDASAKPVKAVITGPYTLMDWSFDEHYATRKDCCLALAAAVRVEAETLLAAGAEDIEIDEPAISARPEELDLALEALGHVTEPLRGKARTWTYLGYGDWEPVIQGLFALPVDGLLLEWTHSGHRVLPHLDDLPPDKLIGVGILDVHDAEVESVDTACARVEKVLERVAADRVWLIPDGGLRTLPESAAEAKLRVLVEAAARLG